MLIGYSQQGAARYSTQAKPQIIYAYELHYDQIRGSQLYEFDNEPNKKLAILFRNALVSQNIERPHTGL